MLTLTFSQKEKFDVSAVPEQWRQYISQREYLDRLTNETTWFVYIKVQPDDSSYRYRKLMQKPQLVLKFMLPFYVEFSVGTYCTFQNQLFQLTRAQDLKKQGTRKVEYTMTLGTIEDYFGMWKIRNIVDAVEQGANAPKDNRLKFSLCSTPREYAELIVRNLNNKQTSVAWEVGECIEASEKTVEFNHAYIDAALSDICNTFNTEFEVEYIGTTKAKLHLRRVEYFKESPVALSYGCGNGFIPGLGRTSETDGLPVKRMFTQGTDRNIDRSTYGAPELLMPKSQRIAFDGTHFDSDKNEDGTAVTLNADLMRTYESDAEGESVERVLPTVSDATKEDSVDCSEIYPSRVGVVSDVKCVNKDKNFYDIIDNTIPADLNFNNYLIAGESMTLIFQDGMLAGKEFDVKYKHDERRFEIVPQEIDGVIMPNETFCPVANADKQQHYAIFGIQLPEAYICNNADKSGASWDMMRAAVKSLYENEDQRFTFSGQLQSLWSKRHWLDVGGKLIVGGHVLFRDEQFAKDGVLIRIIGIKDYLTAPYAPTIELSNSVSASSASVSNQLRQITNTEVVVEDAKKSLIQYTKRRFRDALETIGLLEDAHIGDFTGSISPVAIQTMALLAGDESLQFRFARKIDIQNADGTTTVNYATAQNVIGYDNAKKQLFATMQSDGYAICLQHLTLRQSAIMTKERRDAGAYLTWAMQSYTSPVLDEASQSYYLYAKVSSTTTEEVGTFVLSSKAISLEQEAGFYHLLCGVLNSELQGERSYVSLYGFTEILPGRISTDLIISNDGKTYFDLVKGEIGGTIRFASDDPDNPYITIIEGGKIKSELIDATKITAKELEVGQEDTQRVVIKPDSEGNGTVKIYDENSNEVTVLEGEDYGNINELYDGSTGAQCEILSRTSDVYEAGFTKGMTWARGKVSVKAESVNSNSYSRIIPLSKVWKTNTPTEVEITLGHISAYAFAQGGTIIQDTTELIKYTLGNAYAVVAIRVETYSEYNEETGELSGPKKYNEVASAYASASADLQNSYNDYQTGNTETIIGGSGSTKKTFYYPSKTSSSGNINVSGKKIRVPAGYHRLTVYLYCTASYSGSNANLAWGNTTGTLSDIAAKWLCDFYVSRYFANGFCLGTRSDNYILAYKTDDGMRFVMENSEIGFDFSKSGIRTRAKGTQWMPLPMLIYKASYNYHSNDNTYQIDPAKGNISCNDVFLSATRTDKGLVTLTFPDSWKTTLGETNVKNLLVQVNAYHQVIDCRVEEITMNAIKVAMSDDASKNDGNFSIVIYYLASV